MTYCVALRLDSGMIFASDSRTNAGVDHIATFCKMRVYEKPGDRVIVLLSSGNLAITQGVINILDRHRKVPDGADTIWSVSSMFDVAALAGDALREMQQRDGKMLMQSGIDASANIIVGGQIADMTAALNWFLNPNMKIQWNYLLAHRDGQQGQGSGWFDGFGVRAAFDF